MGDSIGGGGFAKGRYNSVPTNLQTNKHKVTIVDYISREVNDSNKWYVSAGMLTAPGPLTDDRTARLLAHNADGRNGMIVVGPFLTEDEATRAMAETAGLYHPYCWQA